MPKWEVDWHLGHRCYIHRLFSDDRLHYVEIPWYDEILPKEKVQEAELMLKSEWWVTKGKRKPVTVRGASFVHFYIDAKGEHKCHTFAPQQVCHCEAYRITWEDANS